ncbi:Uncharacterized protein ABC855_g3019 [[Candida] zeylanoides]
MRVSLRRAVYFVVFAVLFLVLVTIHVSLDPTVSLAAYFKSLRQGDPYSAASFRQSDLAVRDRIHYKNKKDRLFESFVASKASPIRRAKLNAHGSVDLDQWTRLPLNERCNLFFKHWKRENPNWSFSKFEKQFDKSIVNKRGFFNSHHNKLRDARNNLNQPNPLEITQEDNDTINDKFEQTVQTTIESEQQMIQTTSLIRVFGKCFVDNVGKDVVNKDYPLYEDLLKKFFPFFTRNLPTFERFDGVVAESKFPGDDVPVYSKERDNLMEYNKLHSHGRGILLSASNKHSRDVIKLVRVLRALNNRLPIQIVHKGDITGKNRDYIVASAQSNIEDLLDSSLSISYEKIFPELNLKEEFARFGSEFPKQEIWFVDIRKTIEKPFKYDFTGYANKLLALYFTSFKEVLLMDTDAVPFLSPEKLLEVEEYVHNGGAYFFRDRTLRDHNDFLETNYFANLMPTLAENSMEQLFEIPTVTKHTLENAYMVGWRHLQEAGVVAIDKTRHLLGIAMTLPLTLWKEPISSSIWGDKELYWLALSIAGDEDYHFNENGAASVGEITQNPSYKYYSGSRARELCSTHPGHVNKHGELLWINSGFSFCKKNGHFRDRNKFPYSEMEAHELQQLFDLPLQIKHAVVPPELPVLRPNGGAVDDTEEVAMIQSWKSRPQDMDEINYNVKDSSKVVNQIKDWNPQKGWVKSNICASYLYCAYDLVDSYLSPASSLAAAFHHRPGLDNKNTDAGRFYAFSEERVNMFMYLSKIWTTGTTRFKMPSKEDTEKKLADEKRLLKQHKKE